MTEDLSPEDLKGRTVYGREANEGDKGRITEVRSPEHERNHYKPGRYEVLIEYDGYVGKEGCVAQKLIDDGVRSWSLTPNE